MFPFIYKGIEYNNCTYVDSTNGGALRQTIMTLTNCGESACQVSYPVSVVAARKWRSLERIYSVQ